MRPVDANGKRRLDFVDDVKLDTSQVKDYRDPYKNIGKIVKQKGVRPSHIEAAKRRLKTKLLK